MPRRRRLAAPDSPFFGVTVGGRGEREITLTRERRGKSPAPISASIRQSPQGLQAVVHDHRLCIATCKIHYSTKDLIALCCIAICRGSRHAGEGRSNILEVSQCSLRNGTHAPTTGRASNPAPSRGE